MVSRQDRKVLFGKVVQPSHLGFKSQSREHSNGSLAATLDRELYCPKRRPRIVPVGAVGDQGRVCPSS